jgi:putative oxygen-independent coproporphyrinogen III oxidase
MTSGRPDRGDRAGKRPFGVYVHFPYCTHRCPYCDFAVSVERAIPQARYTRAVLAELALRAPGFDGLSCRSLYLGGGTPSLWEPERVGDVVRAVRERCGLHEGAEVTLEANPESCERERLLAYRAAGVNRLSLGVQSLDAAVLHKLGRRHGPERAMEAVETALAAFSNVTVDLIYGARRSSVATAREDGRRLGALGVPHVSAYALTLDPDLLAEEVPLARMQRAGRLPLPSEDDTVAQADALRAALRRAGLVRYEVSNFARPGFESVHNRIYWAGESYLGLGAGAVGCLHAGAGALRWSNPRAPGPWLEALDAGRLPPTDEERLGPREVENERVMLGLRTRGGIALEGLSPAQRAEVARLVRQRLGVVRGGRLTLTSRGLDLHSAIAERLFA